MPKAQRGSGTTDITAPPDLVYDLIAVVTRTGEWSPKCYRYERLDGATPPRTRARSASSAGHSGTKRGRDATVSPCSSALHPTTLEPRHPSRRRLNYAAGIKPRRFIQECPMIKVFGYLKRKPGLSQQEFADYYEHNHVPLVLSKAFMPMVYKRNYIQRGDAFNIEGNEISFDCMTELVFADRDDLSAWMASLGVDEIARDEENFIDRAATRAYVVDERTTAG
jgi:uncharacterized protein (TIGR02118 family)